MSINQDSTTKQKAEVMGDGKREGAERGHQLFLGHTPLHKQSHMTNSGKPNGILMGFFL